MSPFFPLLAGLGLTLLATAAHAQTPDNSAPPVLNPAPVATPAPAAAPAASSPAPVPAPAQVRLPRSYPHSSLALVLGWGAPYGWGLEFSEMATPNLDINIGAGLSVTGTKLGIGSRYYFAPERRVSTWLGGNLVYSGGIENIPIKSNSSSANNGYNNNPGQSGVISYKSATLLHLRGGMRWQPVHRFAMFGGLGYGIRLNGGNVEYVSGSFDQPTRDAIEFLSPGGVELSVGMALGFN